MNPEPACDEMMALYLELQSVANAVADLHGTPYFSDATRELLARWFKDSANIELVEAIARNGKFDNDGLHAERRHEINQHLREKGMRRPPGKRPGAALEALVKSLTPLLLRLGLPFASGESSRLVLALRAIALDFCVKGDPRDELRRRIKEERRIARRTEILLITTAIEALRPDFTNSEI